MDSKVNVILTTRHFQWYQVVTLKFDPLQCWYLREWSELSSWACFHLTGHLKRWHEQLYTTGIDIHVFMVLANLYLKHDISSECVMVDFICMGLLNLWEARTENYKIKNYFPQLDSNPEPFASEANSQRCAISWDIYRALKCWQRFTWVFYLNYLYYLVGVVNWFVVYFSI